MPKRFAFAVVLSLAGCLPEPAPQTPQALALPFDAGFTATPLPGARPGTVKLRLRAAITRTIVPEDGLAFVVRSGGREIERFPIAGEYIDGYTLHIRPSLDTHPPGLEPTVELALGDYDLDVEYAGTRYWGTTLRVAEVPYWGGRKQVEAIEHIGTTLDLHAGTLAVAQWWADDAPAQPWVIEWRRDGQVIMTTTGHEGRWLAAHAPSLVYDAGSGSHQSIWRLRQEYRLPREVEQTPGAWEARIAHGGAAPIAVRFAIAAPRRPAATSGRLIAAREGWVDQRSAPLAIEPLPTAEAAPLIARLDSVERKQAFDDGASPRDLVEPIALSTPAVRALFRSKQLVDAWDDFLALNSQAPGYVDSVYFTNEEDYTLSPEQKWKRKQAADRRAERDAPRTDAAAKTRLRTLRPKIEQLIRKHGGAWQPRELPRS